MAHESRKIAQRCSWTRGMWEPGHAHKDRKDGPEPPDRSAVEAEMDRDRHAGWNGSVAFGGGLVAPVSDQVAPGGIEKCPVRRSDRLNGNHSTAVVDREP